MPVVSSSARTRRGEMIGRPAPDEANVPCPDFFFRYSISSRTLLTESPIGNEHVRRANRQGRSRNPRRIVFEVGNIPD